MAGEGKRFREAGYLEPKPLIDVCGVPMAQRVIANLATNREYQFIFVTRFPMLTEKGVLIHLKELTEGAACSALAAEKHINGNHPLVIANCDQLILDFSLDDFIGAMEGFDAGAVTFTSQNPWHSYIKVDGAGVATSVAEKEVISNNAVAGIYYYRHGSDFVKYARQMIAKNIRCKNEFYISPIFNEYIGDGKKIGIYPINEQQKQMLGTPEELAQFLARVERGGITLV